MGCREREDEKQPYKFFLTPHCCSLAEPYLRKKIASSGGFCKCLIIFGWDGRPRLPHLKATRAMWAQNNSPDWVSRTGGYQLTVASVESQLFKVWREGICVQLPRIEYLVPGSGCLSYCILSPEPLWPEVRLAEGLAWSLCWLYDQLS